MPKEPAVGIDLGTTYSVVSVLEHGRVTVIANDKGRRITPSYVSFTHTQRLIGDDAKRQIPINPENTVFDVKRLIGRQNDDPLVQKDLKDNNWPFKVVNNNKSTPSIQVQYKGATKTFVPEEVSAMVLGMMKEIAEVHLKKVVTEAVITVPAYFNDSQRQATKDAGEIAGLNVLRIISEPTAAAIAYGLDKKIKGEQTVLVFDLGGGTFDVSILTLEGGIFEVRSTSGNTHLGGQDFDLKMFDHFVKEFKEEHDVDIRNNRRAMVRLRVACENAKITLSSASSAQIELDSLHNGLDFYTTITRAKFEELNKELFEKTLDSVQQALTDAKLNRSDIDEIIMVGGSTRIPRIQKLVRKYFEGKRLNKSINPDEAVGHGAGVLAAMLAGCSFEELEDLVLLDVMPLSLGVQVKGGVISTLTKRNRTIPTKETKPFTTVEDNQTRTLFKVFEGERALAKDNHLLGEFLLKGIKPAPRGKATIDVTFDIDANGILNATAEDRETGSKEGITIKNDKGRLSKEDIQRLVKEAEQYKFDDNRELARVSARNGLDHRVYQIKSILLYGKYRGRITETSRTRLQDMCVVVSDWLDQNQAATAGEIEGKRKELEASYRAAVGHLEDSGPEAGGYNLRGTRHEISELD